MPLRALIAVLVLGVFASQARAADRVGYAEAFNVLYSVNLDARSATQIGAAGPIYGQPSGNIEGLTFSPSGVLYAVNDASAIKTLLTIDKNTGLATPVGILNLSGTKTSSQLDLGLSFTCDGRLWMSSRYGDLWRIDPVDASASLIGNIGVAVTGLAARNNQLFGAGSQGNNNFYSIDTANAQASLLGGYGSSNYITTASPGFDSAGQLWAILAYVPPQPGTTQIADWSDLAIIDQHTGALSKLGNIVGPPELKENFFSDLKGLAIAAPVCTAAAVPFAIPIFDARGIIALVLAMLLAGGVRLRHCRPAR